EVILFSAAMDAWGHHLPRRRAEGIETVLRQTFADDVAVGHHADQVVVLPNRNGAYVMLTHQFGEVGDGGVRADPVDAFVHGFFNLHVGPPYLEWVRYEWQRRPVAFNYTADRVCC